MNNRLILKPNKEEKPTSYEVFFGETNKIGDFDMLEDGFFYFYPNTKHLGYFNEYSLELICNELKNLNNPWREFIDADFKRMKEIGFENQNNLPNFDDVDDLPF